MIAAAMPKTPQSARHGGAFETSPTQVSAGQRQPRSPRANAPLNGDWHDTCHNTYITCARRVLVMAADLPSSVGRGGARNRGDRESNALTAAQIANLKAAERHAATIGLPFTRMISIHWEAAGMPLAGMAKATGRFVDLLTRWLKRKGHRTAGLWVHENCGPKGGHGHMLAHVPPDCVKALTGQLRGWLRLITGQPYRARVIHSKPIGGRLGLETGNPDLHANNLEAALGYVLKGASPEAASQFALARLEPGGRVIGKRCGTSQNIGAKARAMAKESEL